MSGVQSAARKAVAVVGAGPGGCYVAHNLLRSLPPEFHVHIYDSRPTPYGLVRYGVAPDHQEVKNVAQVFNEELMAHKRVRFFGNTPLNGSYTNNNNNNSGITLGALVGRYRLGESLSGVVLAMGPSADSTFGVREVDAAHERHVRNFVSAREIVQWYNKFPSASKLAEDAPLDLKGEKTGLKCVVFGQGNVALDIARFLISGRSRFLPTDAAKAAIDQVYTCNNNNTGEDGKKTKFAKVSLVGRRGPLQVAFSTKELREVFKLATTGDEEGDDDPRFYISIDRELLDAELKKYKAVINKSRPLRRKMELLKKMSDSSVNVHNVSESKLTKPVLEFRFLESPQRVQVRTDSQPDNPVFVDELVEGDEDDSNSEIKGEVCGIQVARNSLEYTVPTSGEINQAAAESIIDGAKARPANSTNAGGPPAAKNTILECDLFVQSIGYKCAPPPNDGVFQLEGSRLQYQIPYDSRKGILVNDRGRVSVPAITPGANVEPLKMFVAGWLKTGCKGKIVDTLQFSNETAEQIVAEIAQVKEKEQQYTESFEPLVNPGDIASGDVVTKEGWLKIDAFEIEQGAQNGRIREKVDSFERDYIRKIIREEE